MSGERAFFIDKYCTNYSDFLTVIKPVSVRFSGAGLRIEGDNVNYQINMDSVYRIVQDGEKIKI